MLVKCMKNISLRLKLAIGRWFRLELDFGTGEKENGLQLIDKSVGSCASRQSIEIHKDKT